MSRAGHSLNLTQCQRIIDNQYRSVCCQYDYEPEEVNRRYYELLNSRSEAVNRKVLSIRQQILAIINTPPAIPSEADEGLDAQYDWQPQPREYIRDYKPNGFSYELIEIPSIIMEF